MAGNIRGITIEIAGNTQPLNRALQDVNNRSRDLQGELRQVERLLRLDPGNTQLVAQQQRILADAVENSREKLNRLRAAQEQVEAQFRRGEIGEEQYRAFQREVAQAEQQLQRFEDRLRQTQQTSRNWSAELQKTGQKLKGLGTTMSAAVTAPIVGGFVALTQGTKELRGDLGRLSANAEVAGQDMGILNDAMARLHAVTGEVDSNVEGLSNLLATGFRDEQLSELLDHLYGAAIKFSDTLKFEGISDGLQETLATGAAIGPFAELLERSGIVLDDFNAGLEAAIANGKEEEYILEVLANTGLAGTYEAWKKQNEEMVKAEEANFRMQQAFAKLGATLEPILTPLIEGVTQLVNKFNEMEPATQKIILVIAGVAAAIGPLLIVIGTLMTAVSGIIPLLGGGAAAGGLAGAFAAITGPIGIAVAAIAGIVAALIHLYKTNEEVRENIKTVWEGIKAVFEFILPAILAFIKSVWENIKGAIKGALDVIAGLVKAFSGLLSGDFEKMWEGIKQVFTGAIEFILNFVQLMLVGKMIAAFKSFAQLGFNVLKDNWANILNSVRGFGTNISSSFSNIWSGIINSTRGAMGNLYSAVKSKLESLWSYIKGIPSQALQWGRNIIQGLINGIKSLRIPLPHFNFSVDYKSVAGVKFPVPDVNVRWYQTGGVFERPVIPGFGDVDEALVPLEGRHAKRIASLIAANMPAAGSSIVIHNMYVRDDQDIHRIARELFTLQQRAARAKGVLA